MNSSKAQALNKLYLLGFIHIAAKCGMIAAQKKLDSILSDQPKSIAEVAAHLNFSLAGTKKFLRVLDAFELIELTDDSVKASALTPHLNYLLGTHLTYGYGAINNLEFSLEHDAPCWEKTYGKNFYQHLSSNPDETKTFSNWCQETTGSWIETVSSFYNFSRYKNIVDLGGSQGQLLLTILKNCSANGVLFDLPEVVNPIKATLAQDPIGKRIQCVAGSFFESIPTGGDLYIISRALLNWSDADALKILNNCYAAMNKEATLLIIDLVLPDKHSPCYQQAVLSDINLYAALGAANRTKAEWLALVAKSNFTISQYHETSAEITADNALIMPFFTLELSKAKLGTDANTR